MISRECSTQSAPKPHAWESTMKSRTGSLRACMAKSTLRRVKAETRKKTSERKAQYTCSTASTWVRRILWARLAILTRTQNIKIVGGKMTMYITSPLKKSSAASSGTHCIDFFSSVAITFLFSERIFPIEFATGSIAVTDFTSVFLATDDKFSRSPAMSSILSRLFSFDATWSSREFSSPSSILCSSCIVASSIWHSLSTSPISCSVSSAYPLSSTKSAASEISSSTRS
mmetsp:Transcript_24709/g.61766  ORF Transcript_24709/g.61766 Transcript_24709/m.61766 type:complete len:229 (+) Transcript_24709:575-1261(+)